MAISIKDFSQNVWIDVYNRIIGAVVFLDDASAECLHWDGGLLNLLSGGAAVVKSLSPFEFCTSQYKKAIFISQATSTQLRTIREIIRNSDFTHCILISTVGLDVVFLELNEGRDVSDIITSGKALTECAKQLEAMVIEWINKKNSAVEALHIPISTITPSNSLFIMPPYSKVYPSFNGNLVPDTPSVDLYTLSSEERSQIRRLASSFNGLFEVMNMKEDIYYMGMYSSLIAGVLENSPVCLTRRKACSNPASLILVDRILDLCSISSHSMESVLDKVMSVLPRFPGHVTEVAVDMSPLCEADIISVTDDVQLSPGCLFHPKDESCIQTYEYMISKTQKEVMFDLYNKLSNIDVQKSPGPKTLLKVTPQSVEKIYSASKGNYDIIEQHLGLLQQSIAVVQTLKSKQHAQLELIANLERQVVQNIATSRESTSVLTQMSHLIKSRKEKNVPLERLLALLVHIYSLTGNEIIFSKQHEEALRETLSVALFEDHTSIFASSESNQIVSPEQCEQISRKIMSRLKDVAQIRKILHKYNSVLKPTEAGVGHEYKGLLQQLMEDMLDSTRPELTDLRHRNDGIKNLLRSGFNILTSKKAHAQHPLDKPTVFVFVVGGVTAEEYKRLHRTVITSGVDATVIIGSTKLVSPVEAMKDALDL